MKKPVVFLSAVSADFASLRDVSLRNALGQLDGVVTVQPVFKTGAEPMLVIAGKSHQ